MESLVVRRSWIAALVVALLGPAPAQAQIGGVDLGDLDARFGSGIALPVGTHGDFYGFGPSFGLDVAYPVNDRLDVLLDLDLDLLRNNATYLPDGKAWRYRPRRPNPKREGLGHALHRTRRHSARPGDRIRAHVMAGGGPELVAGSRGRR